MINNPISYLRRIASKSQGITSNSAAQAGRIRSDWLLNMIS